MGLKEKAIDSYKKEKELREQSEIRDAEKFAEEALKVLRDIIGGEYDSDVETLSKTPYNISFSVDGILFRATSSQGYPGINIVVKCPACGTDVYSKVVYFRDIGRALVEPHSQYDCDQAIRLKQEDSDRKNGRIMNTDERLLEALGDFVKEHDTPCSSI
jgi:hypothetical protein